MHIFEYTTQLAMTPEMALITPALGNPRNYVPAQLILALKHRNTKLVNSYRYVWRLSLLTEDGFILPLQTFYALRFAFTCHPPHA